MKKIILATTVIVLGTTATTFAQGPSSSANATLNVLVSNVKSISVSAGSTVNINLDDAQKFTAAAGTTGVAGDVKSTIDVISSGAYKVKVSLAGNAVSLRNTNNNATGITSIPVGNIYLAVSNPRQITAGSTAPNAGFSSAGQNLINTANTLIATPATASNGNAGTSGTKYDVTYSLANFADVASLATGTFTATVVYTITDL
ncbi:hypothetical protein [Taibaiella koreensis]|uniref:hypothetical protein n=1 Tax=Taibaiella koreensis TaxID=1268548 RepID=UPI000E59ACCB|nr:hypothetical protein [Taibaiella koreensis]